MVSTAEEIVSSDQTLDSELHLVYCTFAMDVDMVEAVTKAIAACVFLSEAINEHVTPCTVNKCCKTNFAVEFTDGVEVEYPAGVEHSGACGCLH